MRPCYARGCTFDFRCVGKWQCEGGNGWQSEKLSIITTKDRESFDVHLRVTACCCNCCSTKASGEAPPTPVCSLGNWVTTTDYPGSAMKEEREGTVGFRLQGSSKGIAKPINIKVKKLKKSTSNDCRIDAAQFYTYIAQI
jgi:hypothetical protein